MSSRQLFSFSSSRVGDRSPLVGQTVEGVGGHLRQTSQDRKLAICAVVATAFARAFLSVPERSSSHRRHQQTARRPSFGRVAASLTDAGSLVQTCGGQTDRCNAQERTPPITAGHSSNPRPPRSTTRPPPPGPANRMNAQERIPLPQLIAVTGPTTRLQRPPRSLVSGLQHPFRGPDRACSPGHAGQLLDLGQRRCRGRSRTRRTGRLDRLADAHRAAPRAG